MDRRVRRTRDALGDALIETMLKQPFDSITVQQVLDRARIGRSTFYAHFRDKNDLFLSDLEDFFEQMSTLLIRRREVSRRLAPVRELFAHVADMRHVQLAFIASGKHGDFLEMGQEYFARAIAQRLAGMKQTRSLPPSRRNAIAQASAGALLSLMLWWVDHGAAASPEEMDDLYHQLIWSGISGAP